MSFSFWEQQKYGRSNQILIIGSGIVGLSSAISLAESGVDRPILVIDRQWPPSGASTKNAGFICYGSPSEVLDDLHTITEDACKALIRLRWEGSKLLKKRIGPDNYELCGGYELYEKGKFPEPDVFSHLNALFKEVTGCDRYFEERSNVWFPGFDERCIFMREEGRIDPVMAVLTLWQKALNMGITFGFGLDVQQIIPDKKRVVTTTELSLPYSDCIVCVNGFAGRFFPDLDITAVRNQVLVTKPMTDLGWDGVFHHHCGYYYFRNIGNRILIGGGRHLDREGETTDKFGPNEALIQHLKDFAVRQGLIRSKTFEVETEWSGILGVGRSKMPIMEKVEEGLYAGVRLGGMGVAIGSQLGQMLADLVLRSKNGNE